MFLSIILNKLLGRILNPPCQPLRVTIPIANFIAPEWCRGYEIASVFVNYKIVGLVCQLNIDYKM